jgi:hypothetical protein
MINFASIICIAQYFHVFNLFDKYVIVILDQSGKEK